MTNNSAEVGNKKAPCKKQGATAFSFSIKPIQVEDNTKPLIKLRKTSAT